MTTCDVAEDLIERHLDGETNGAEETALLNHLSGCASCSRRSDREAALYAHLVAAFANAMPSPGFGPGVLRRVRREAPAGRVEWIAEVLNAGGGLVMVVLTARVLGAGGLRSGGMLLAIVGGVVAVSLYPLLLARLAGNDSEAARRT
jgi:predicted anti-sigma-YlaC factor YlaD